MFKNIYLYVIAYLIIVSHVSNTKITNVNTSDHTSPSTVNTPKHTSPSTVNIPKHTSHSIANIPIHTGHSTTISHHTENTTVKVDRANVDIRQMMTKLGIIPHVLPDRPYEICEVTYEFPQPGGGTYRHKVVPGEHLNDNETVFAPQIRWPNMDSNSLHTIYLLGSSKWRKDLYPTQKPLEKDVDYPQMIEWENWISINMPGCDILKANHLCIYLPPGNPIEHNVEEYFTFLVFKQKDRIPYVPLQPAEYAEKDGQPRFHFPDEFKVTDFIKMYNLTGPIAVNFFVTKYRTTMEDVRSLQEAEMMANMSTLPLSTTPYPTHKLNTMKENILNMLKNYSDKFSTKGNQS